MKLFVGLVSVLIWCVGLSAQETQSLGITIRPCPSFRIQIGAGRSLPWVPDQRSVMDR